LGKKIAPGLIALRRDKECCKARKRRQQAAKGDHPRINAAKMIGSDLGGIERENWGGKKPCYLGRVWNCEPCCLG